MTLSINEIKAPIAEELKIFELKFRASMKSKVPLLDRITHYIVKRKGKKIRPMFVLLTAKIFGDINEKTYRGAALIELLHTATLVHDDVVDNAYERRGFFSVNALWKNKIAVLVGDYILSRGLLLSLENNDFQLLKVVSRAVKAMSEGELLQIEKARKLDIDESTYFKIIRQKTATLIASACACGGAAQEIGREKIEELWKLGEMIGTAFQMKDDLFDFGNENTGKPKAIDIKEKKMTLPLIYALSKTDKENKRRVLSSIRNNSNDSSKISDIIDFVYDNGGIEYTRSVMKEYTNNAIKLLHSFPDSQSRKSLEQLILFTIERHN